jgi:uncharacterized membrane protein YcfT
MQSMGRQSSPFRDRDMRRVEWVDYAKGICILLVVMMHATLGVELAVGRTGFMHAVVEFAKPFRMPAFFLISGLFLARTIDDPWRRFLDRKVLHFAYFYILWLTIQFALKGPEIAMEQGVGAVAWAYLSAFWQPFGTLWFIYVLPLFFLAARLLRHAPVLPVLIGAAVLEILPIATGSLIIDETSARFVYFYAGYVLARRVFAFEAASARIGAPVFLALAAWAVLNAALALTRAPEGWEAYAQVFVWDTGIVRLADLAGLSLIAGLAGSLALVAACGLVAQRGALPWLRWIGAHSIVIYLAFFLPMAVTRIVLVRTGLIESVGLMSLIVWAAAVIGPLVLYALVTWSGYGRFLFERPAWARRDQPASPHAARERLAPGE